jgi:sulfatase maturation enzyme AslB (radical SAM superfamily)
MANQKIFCSTPWTKLHIYWDGSYGVCCQEYTKPYDTQYSSKFNLATMTLNEWYSSVPMQEIRKQMLGDKHLNLCYRCYGDEKSNHESLRIKENFKSVIFTEHAFKKSYEQTPLYKIFEKSRTSGLTSALPIDWHVDLGNECNLACKMCNPRASSKIAAHYKRWNILDSTTSIFSNWTKNEKAWTNFLNGIKEVPYLNRIHFIGGEPLLNKKFESIIDFLIKFKPDVSVSFTSNGTIIKQSLLDKLSLLRSCDIEISIESINKTNNYIRQGSNVEELLHNIEIINRQKNDRLNLVLSTVPQLLNVNSYYEIINWCLENRVALQGNVLWRPIYLRIGVLPKEIREKIKSKYYPLKTLLEDRMRENISTITTGISLAGLDQQLLRETNSIINLLDTEINEDPEPHRYELIKWLNRWDKEYDLNALDYYPEYADFFIKYGYGKI